MQGALPESVVRFIAEHIDSTSQLDALLLLRAAPDKSWTAHEVGRALVTGDNAAEIHLQHLCTVGLAERAGESFTYSPGRTDRTVDQLADAYAKRRHTVIAVIYSSDSRTVHTISEAFRLRRRKD